MKQDKIIKRIKPMAAAFLLLALSALLGACSRDNGKVLRVGVNTDVPGFGYYNESNQVYSGLEIDLARMLSGRMGYSNIEFVPVKLDERQAALKEDRADIIIATYTVTEERKKELVFTRPYCSTGLSVMVQKSSLFTSLDDLKGYTVGVAPGTICALELAKYLSKTGRIPEFDTDSFDPLTFDNGIRFAVMDHPALSDALDKGTIDAICTDSSILKGYLNDERLQIKETFSFKDYAIAVLPDSPIAATVCTAMDELQLDGSINALIKKWE